MENTNNSFVEYPNTHPRVGEGSGYQTTRDGTAVELQDEEASSSSYPDPLLFVDAYEWTANNLPIGISFDSEYRIPTPEFMRGWTYEPPEEIQEENQVTYMGSRGTGYVAQLVDPSDANGNAEGLRRSGRHAIASRTPFPNDRPPWAMLATDFRSISAIPGDVMLWCPGCTRALPREGFRMAFMDQNPVETCIICRKGQAVLPDGLLICWSDYKGCGRLLPAGNFSGSHTHDTFTGVFCHDCRAFGHSRARLEGRYVKTGA
ncbi:hypothetical protein F4820DRAFT_450551 [Hypoxylon rubiginosum]|uniref:Uncharacterized protein n=1 Tax=Hypoxylon rubiginosum TaxID=110542 RepID=A0ACB9YUZ2_9PEZI|nr:hypothetical protein F4820DRAFT_450551 [Hypoxylon rubiginosum]